MSAGDVAGDAAANTSRPAPPRRTDLAGGAVAALIAVVLDERRLQRMELAGPAQPLDRGDAAAFVHHGQRQTRIEGAAHLRSPYRHRIDRDRTLSWCRSGTDARAAHRARSSACRGRGCGSLRSPQGYFCHGRELKTLPAHRLCSSKCQPLRRVPRWAPLSEHEPRFAGWFTGGGTGRNGCRLISRRLFHPRNRR